MTAEALVVGRRPDGTVRRYALETPRGPGQSKLIHVLATRTGELTYCGQRIRPILNLPIQQARAMEHREDNRSKGFSWCRECYKEMTPQPDTSIWGPPHPSQT